MASDLTEPDARAQIADHPEVWVDQHGEYLFRYAMHRMAGTAAAEDVVQETFLAALQSRANFDGRSSFRTWLTSILRHKIADRLREARPEVGEDVARLEQWAESLFNDKGKWGGGPRRWSRWPTSDAERSELSRVLERCLGKIPAQIAEMFVLHEQHRVPGPRLAASLGISTGNLWVRLYRARLALRECLEKNWFKASRT
ncbi:MAG: sigma-70 family RNA polymerase sigma factor [Planctomycetota bacterium]|jgi:RNA polymerase sigma-70 factor (ECF subfamily)